MPKFIRLTDYKSSDEKEKGFFDPKNRYTARQKDFSKIPGSPIAYWVSERVKEIFEKNKKLRDIAEPRQGLITGDNDRFLRYWYEVNIFKTSINKEGYFFKWYPYSKGGEFRRWFGNSYYIVNWEDNGKEIINFVDDSGKQKSRPQNIKYFFKKGMTWTSLTSGNFNGRYLNKSIFDAKGPVLFLFNNTNLLNIIAFCNSIVSNSILKILSPTMDFNQGPIGNLPYISPKKYETKQHIDNLTQQNINISKQEWDSRETSWDFNENELIRLKKDDNLINSYNSFCSYWKEQFFILHKNEEELNRLFIDIYELADEITPNVEYKDITILKTEAKIIDNELVFQKDEIIKQLLSYALGCFMGRYRLDKPGLHIAHPDPTDEEIQPYQYKGVSFEIDDDAIIPLMGSNCGFSDDIVYRVKSFIELVWGKETLTGNINFIEDALGKDLEKYLINDSWKYHVKMYKKKPIYWLFSSSKGAFKVVVYMHRMNRFTVQKIRNNYLLPHINYLSREIEVLKNNESNLSKEEFKRLTKLIKGEIECNEYEKFVKDIADKQINFDLDDGVTVNHKKFEGIVEKIK